MKKPMKTKHYARQCQVSVAGVTPHSLRLNGASVRRRSPFGVFLLFLVLCFALFAVSCGGDDDSGGSISPAISSGSSTSSGSSGSGDDGLTITEIPESTAKLPDVTTDFYPDKYRVNFGAFQASWTGNTARDYIFAAQTKAKPAPTAAEMRAAVTKLTLTLSSTPINFYLPFHIEGSYPRTGNEKYNDPSATAGQVDTTLPNTVLQENTDYVLYVTRADITDSVSAALNFKTDSLPGYTADRLFNIPPAYPSEADRVANTNQIVYTVRKGEPLINSVITTGSTVFTDPSATDVIFECTLFGNNCPFKNAIQLEMAHYYHYNVTGTSAFDIIFYTVFTDMASPSAYNTSLKAPTKPPANINLTINLAYQEL